MADAVDGYQRRAATSDHSRGTGADTESAIGDSAQPEDDHGSDEQAARAAIRSAAIMANESFSKGLTSTLGAPPFVDLWRRRALRVGLVLAIAAVILALLGQKFDQPALGWDHFLRGWLEGFVGCCGLCMGAMALLMVQYLSGGKWGLIVRRPLEAMTRTWPLIVLMWIPVAILGASYGKLYIYTKYADWRGALAAGKITIEQAHAIHWKQPMLNAT